MCILCFDVSSDKTSKKVNSESKEDVLSLVSCKLVTLVKDTFLVTRNNRSHVFLLSSLLSQVNLLHLQRAHQGQEAAVHLNNSAAEGREMY